MSALAQKAKQMSLNTALVSYIINHQPALIHTDFSREIFMIPDRMVGEYVSEAGEDIHFTITSPSPLYEGKLFVYDGMFYGVTSFVRTDDHQSDDKVYAVVGEKTGIKYNVKENTALCRPQDTMILNPGDIANYQEKNPLDTTVGIFIANYLFLVYPFGDKINYLNEEFTASKLEKLISPPLLDGRITSEEVKNKYINALSLFGQSNEIICPNISEKTVTVPKAITDLREKLVKENRAALEAGDASVMSEIEKQLITAYREYLKGDPSLHFLLKKKYFDVTLKKLFLTQGMTEIFGSPGKFTFIDNPMGKGWKQDDLPTIFNEVRSGSYSRAVETANGGVIAKLILRVFQDTRIAIDDCDTARGEHVHTTPGILKDFVGNYVIEKNGANTCLTDDNLTTFEGRDLVIRTPGYCQATQGFCARCFGYTFEVLGQKAFAPVANDFARNQTTSSLKSMHGKSHSTVDVSDVDRYLVGV